MTEDTINNLEMLGSGDSMEIEEVKSQIVPVSKKTSYKPRPDRREKVRELMVNMLVIIIICNHTNMNICETQVINHLHPLSLLFSASTKNANDSGGERN